VKRRLGVALWCVVGLAASLFAVQTGMADSDVLTLRYLWAVLAIGVVAIGVMSLRRLSFREVFGPPPEPISLIISGLAALSVWAVAWWLMDGSNHLLEERAGLLPVPQFLAFIPDKLPGVDLASASYELQILFVVVLLPLLQAWLIWGLAQSELGVMIGRWRAAWVTGALFGAFNALIAVQDVEPAMPWGLASLGGYLLIGIVAALVVYLTGSAWAGFATHSTFVYASFALRDDLSREMLGKDYFDLAWLTLILLGVSGAAILLQVIRFRDPRPAEPERDSRRLGLRLYLPLALLLGAVIVMAALDIEARQ